MAAVEAAVVPTPMLVGTQTRSDRDALAAMAVARPAIPIATVVLTLIQLVAVVAAAAAPAIPTVTAAHMQIRSAVDDAVVRAIARTQIAEAMQTRPGKVDAAR